MIHCSFSISAVKMTSKAAKSHLLLSIFLLVSHFNKVSCYNDVRYSIANPGYRCKTSMFVASSNDRNIDQPFQYVVSQLLLQNSVKELELCDK